MDSICEYSKKKVIAIRQKKIAISGCMIRKASFMTTLVWNGFKAFISNLVSINSWLQINNAFDRDLKSIASGTNGECVGSGLFPR